MKPVVLIGLGLILGSASAFASVDDALIALLPSNSKIVAGIDVTKCKSSDFGQYLLSKSQANDAHFDQFMTQTGFDPRRDLETVVMSSSGDKRGSSYAILARGSFDVDKLQALAISKGAVTETFEGVTLVEHKEQKQTVAFAFPDAGIAVMGDLDSIHQVVQNLSAPSSLDVDLMNRIHAIGSANDAWLVSGIGGAILGREITAQAGTETSQMNQAEALKSIRAASGGVQFGSTVAVTFDAATRSVQDANSLSDVVRFMASMIQMQRQQDPRAAILASSMDTMQIQTNGDSVHVAFTMPEKSLEQMADLGPGRLKFNER